MLDPCHRRHIRAGLASLKSDPDAVARDFYDRLFHAEPGLRPLFPDDMRRQAAKLRKVLALVAHSPEDLVPFVPALESLGARHVEYGVAETDYALFGRILLDTLADHVPGWTEADRAAWEELYRVTAGMALRGARAAAAHPAP